MRDVDPCDECMRAVATCSLRMDGGVAHLCADCAARCRQAAADEELDADAGTDADADLERAESAWERRRTEGPR